MKLNKRKKGLAALAAGAALLAGTAGTFALWYDTTAFSGGVDAITTGTLTVDGDLDGYWAWSRVSNTNQVTSALIGNPVSETQTLVPGDAVDYIWDVSDIDLLLEGTTLVASLYLDGTIVSPSAILPLIVLVDGQPIAFTDSQHFLLDSGLHEGVTSVDSGDLDLPVITLDFPEGETFVGPLGDLNGYGRGQTVSLSQIANLQVRLQQDTN